MLLTKAIIKDVIKKVKQNSTECRKYKNKSHSTIECFNFKIKNPKFITIEQKEDNKDSVKKMLFENNFNHIVILKGTMLDIINEEEVKEPESNKYTIVTNSLGEFTKMTEFFIEKGNLIKMKYDSE